MNHQIKVAALAAAALALAACSGVGSSVPGALQNSQSQSISHGGSFSQAGIDTSKVIMMRTVAAAQSVRPNTPHLTYRNGPVQRKPSVFVIYWGFSASGSDPSGEMTYMNAFLNGLGGSAWNNVDHQYYQIVGGLTQKIQNKAGQLKGTWVDTSAIPSSPTDAQIQQAALRGMAHFGFQRDGSYVVATSHNHNTGGFGTQYCAYHGATSGSGHIISYTNLPYMTDAGANCGQNFINPGSGGLLDGVSIVEGHELAESQTDPQPVSGWYDNFNGENGDICAWVKPPAGDVTFTTGTFAVQGIWSNHSNSCTITGV